MNTKSEQLTGVIRVIRQSIEDNECASEKYQKMKKNAIAAGYKLYAKGLREALDIMAGFGIEIEPQQWTKVEIEWQP